MKKTIHAALGVFAMCIVPACVFAQSAPVKQVKLTNFDLQSSALVSAAV